jgi:hypothetical protein
MRRKQRHSLPLDALVYDVTVGQAADLGVQILPLYLHTWQLQEKQVCMGRVQ